MLCKNMRLNINKMKHCHFIFLFVLLMFLPEKALSLEKLSTAESKNVTAQSGLSMAADDVILYLGSDSVRFKSRNNTDAFGAPVAGEGHLAFNNTSGMLTLDNTTFMLDVGTYFRPNETYRVADMARNSDGDFGWLEPGRLAGLSGTISSSPQYWTIPNPQNPATRPEPMDGQYGVIQAEINDLFDTFDLTTTLGIHGGVGSEETLSTLNISGVHMPPLNVGGVDMPGAKLTLYPDSNANINFELRTRLTIDEITMSNPLNIGPPDLKVSGIHVGETFYNMYNHNPLPSHYADFGSAGAAPDTSAWGSSFTSFMYSGYFLIGNLNQVNFPDYLKKNDNGRQIFNRSINTNDRNPLHDDLLTGINDSPVWITPNPMSLNIGMRDDPDNLWDGNSYFSLSGGLHGSIRVESIQGQGEEMGPIAIDGIRVKHLKIEFPGGYTRDHYETQAQADDLGHATRQIIGTTARGLIWEGQLDYLNNL